MTPAASASAPARGFLRVERIFADTYGVVRRHFRAYLILTLLCGVAPSLLISSLYGAAPGDLAATPLTARLAAMALFILGDAILSGALARMTFDDLTATPTSLGRQLGGLKGRLGTLLLAAAAVDVPILALNLFSQILAPDRATGLALYGLRFGVGVTLGAIWAGAGAAILAEGLSARDGLARAAQLTWGQRPRVALFFAAFFLLKVLGPYLLIDFGLHRLAALAGGGPLLATAVALIGMTVWNLLACALGVATALIYVALRDLKAASGL
jgi:hypothetical protein